MAFLHKLIEGGEQWLPFAMSRLRALRPLFTGKNASQTFTMPDGAEVRVAISGEEEYVRISGGGPAYEFFTSEHVTLGAEVPEGYPGKFNPGSGTRIVGKSAKPIFSDTFAPDPIDPKWWKPADPWLDFSTTGAQSIVENKKFFRTWASWQQEKNQEHVWWPNNGSKALVTSTQGIAQGSLSQCGWFGLAGPPPLYGSFSDVGYDVPPAYYSPKITAVGAPALEGEVWWRRAAVYSAASDEFGSRKFFIMTDSHGRFHVYPVKAYQNTETGASGYAYLFLPPNKFKTYTPDYPDWVYRPAVGSPVDFSGFVWTFNKDATKAVTTPFHRAAGELWHPVVSNPEDLAPILDITKKPIYRDFGVVGRPITTVPTGTTHVCADDTPGLFEIGINIALTGLGDMEFDVTLTPGTTAFYGTDGHAGEGRYYVDAGYLLRNKRLGTPEEAATALGAAEDALLTAEIEIWGAPNPIARDGHPWSDEYYSQFNSFIDKPGVTDATTARFASSGISSYYVVRNHATQDELWRCQLTATAGWVEGPLGGYYRISETGLYNAVTSADLRTLSFIVRRNGNGTHPVGSDTRLSEVYVARELVAGPVGNNGFDEPTSYLPSKVVAPVASAELVKLPVNPADTDAAKLLKQGAALRCASPELSGRITAHPQGHWSVEGAAVHADINGELDIIQAYVGKDAKKRMSHKGAFNKAFGQTRGYSFYDTGADVDSDGGGFGTTGIWKTF